MPFFTSYDHAKYVILFFQGVKGFKRCACSERFMSNARFTAMIGFRSLDWTCILETVSRGTGYVIRFCQRCEAIYVHP